MAIEHLFVCRHGVYNGYGRDAALTTHGRVQAERLGGAIKRHLQGVQPAVLSSICTRAKETAVIIAEILKVSVEEAEVLWNDSSHPGNVEKSLELIMGRTESAVVVVTHLEFTHEIPKEYTSRVLGGSFGFPTLGYGEMWQINCQEKTCMRLDS